MNDHLSLPFTDYDYVIGHYSLNHHINKKELYSKIELWQLNQAQKELISKCNMRGKNEVLQIVNP